MALAAGTKDPGTGFIWDGRSWNTAAEYKKTQDKAKAAAADAKAKNIPAPMGKVADKKKPKAPAAKVPSPSEVTASLQAYKQLVATPPAGMNAATWAETVRKNLGLSAEQIKANPNTSGTAKPPANALAAPKLAVEPRTNALAAPTPTRSLQSVYSTPTTEAGVAPGVMSATQAARDEVYQQNKALVEQGVITYDELMKWVDAAKPMTADQSTQNALSAPGQVAAAQQQTADKNTALERDRIESLRVASTKDPVNQALNWVGDRTSDVGNFLSPVLDPMLKAVGLPAIGFNYSSATSPNPAGFMPNSGGDAGNAASASPVPAQVQMPSNNSDPYPLMGDLSGTGALNIPPSNSIYKTPIDMNTVGTGGTPPATVGTTGNLASAAGSVKALPTAAALAGAAAASNAGIPSVESGGVNGTMTGTNGVSATGTGPTGTPVPPVVPPVVPPTGTGTGTPAAPPGIDAATWATVIAAMAGAGMSMYTGQQQAAAAEKAAGLQATAAEKARALQEKMYDETRNDLAPWRAAGETALDQLNTFDTNNPNFQFNTTPGTEIDPSYSFRLKEGMSALQNSAAARGNLLSGNTMKGISDYGQESASQEYNNAFNRYQTQRGTKLNRLQSLAGVGQTAVQQSQQAGQNYASGAGNAMVGGANAQAQGITDSAAASGMGWMGVTNSMMGGLNNYYQQQQSQADRGMINALLGGR